MISGSGRARRTGLGGTTWTTGWELAGSLYIGGLANCCGWVLVFLNPGASSAVSYVFCNWAASVSGGAPGIRLAMVGSCGSGSDGENSREVSSSAVRLFVRGSLSEATRPGVSMAVVGWLTSVVF